MTHAQPLVTVIIASQMGLPVSSTHIALGGVFGVGFLREFIKTSYSQMLDEIKSHHLGDDKETVARYLNDFAKADIKQKRIMLEQLKAKTAEAQLTKSERKQMRKEREQVAGQGIEFRWYHGGQLSEAQWDFVFACYANTYAVRRQSPYLTRAFFSLLAERMPTAIRVVLAKQGTRPVAMA